MTKPDNQKFYKPAAIGLGVLSVVLLVMLLLLITSLVSVKNDCNAKLLAAQNHLDNISKELEMQKKQSQVVMKLAQMQTAKKTVSIVVAKRPIKAGTVISEDDLTLKEVNENFKPDGSFNRPGAFIGKTAIVKINTNEPVLESSIIRPLPSKEEYNKLMKDYEMFHKELKSVFDENEQLKKQLKDLQNQKLQHQ